MNISNNKILITGGASGIGLGLTKRFVEEKNTVTVCGRHGIRAQRSLRETSAAGLSDEELTARPNNAPSAAFHLRHIAGSINRLLTYSRGEELNEAQFNFLKQETTDDANSNAADLINRAVFEINNALESLKNTDSNALFEERFVGRRKLPTNVFGLLFHIAEHTARHVGQIVTTAKIVKERH